MGFPDQYRRLQPERVAVGGVAARSSGDLQKYRTRRISLLYPFHS